MLTALENFLNIKNTSTKKRINKYRIHNTSKKNHKNVNAGKNKNDTSSSSRTTRHHHDDSIETGYHATPSNDEELEEEESSSSCDDDFIENNDKTSNDSNNSKNKDVLNDNNTNTNTNKKINTTMANFFAPLPIKINPGHSNTNDNNKDSDKQDHMEVDYPHGTPPTLIRNKNNISNGAVTVDGESNNNNNNNNGNSNVWYVARYGRIYKRKAPSKVGYSHVPCPPGHRYCKECQKPVPLDKFYTNVKRYICRHHHYLRVNKRFRERVMTSDYEKMAEIAWLDLFRICPILGYAKADYDRHDIKDLVINTKIPLSICPKAVPIDPSIPMRPRNVAIISSANMAILIKVFVMSCSRAQYILLVQSCNLIPINADAGVPWAPYHNPDYVREDIDVIPLLEMEKTMPKERPHVEAVWELMKEDKLKIDECKNRLGREEQPSHDTNVTNNSIIMKSPPSTASSSGSSNEEVQSPS